MIVNLAIPSVEANVDRPTLAFADTLVEFGVVSEGHVVEHVFLTNQGPGNAVLADVSTTCGCTVAKTWPKTPIGPGESAAIEVTFNTRDKSGPQDKVVAVVANTDPSAQGLTLSAQWCLPADGRRRLVGTFHHDFTLAGGGMSTLLMLAGMFAIMYFFMIRLNEATKRGQSNRDAVKKGDHVVTIGGLHGKVISVSDKTVVVELESSSPRDKSALSPTDLPKVKNWKEGPMTAERSMPLWVAVVPVALLVALLGADVVFFGEDSSYGSNQIALSWRHWPRADSAWPGAQPGTPFATPSRRALAQPQKPSSFCCSSAPSAAPGCWRASSQLSSTTA